MSQPGLHWKQNRTGVPNLKGEVLKQWELMKREVWQGRLQSHSVSLYWPLLYHKPQRHTAGRSAGAATQPPGMSPDRLCIEAAQSSPFKEEGGEIYLHGYFPSLVSQIHYKGSSFSPNPKSCHPAPSVAAEEARPSTAVSCCIQAWKWSEGPETPRVQLTGARWQNCTGPWRTNQSVSVAAEGLASRCGWECWWGAEDYSMKQQLGLQSYPKHRSRSSFFSFCQISPCAENLDCVPNDKSIADMPT